MFVNSFSFCSVLCGLYLQARNRLLEACLKPALTRAPWCFPFQILKQVSGQTMLTRASSLWPGWWCAQIANSGPSLADAVHWWAKGALGAKPRSWKPLPASSPRKKEKHWVSFSEYRISVVFKESKKENQCHQGGPLKKTPHLISVISPFALWAPKAGWGLKKQGPRKVHIAWS